MSGRQAGVEVVVLGSGTSHGVPMIGCTCAVCTSDDPRDRRTRPSVFVRFGSQRILVDTAPELRLQCIGNDVAAIDAVLYTHHHADHVAGLDDLRRFNGLMKSAVSCYGTQRTLENLRKMFRYAFAPAPDTPHSRPKLALHTIDDAPFVVGDQTILPIPLMHGPLPVMGFRFGRFAYCTDCNGIPDRSMALLQDLDWLVLDALRRRPHPTHYTLDEAVAMAGRVGAKRTLFTHIAHDLAHDETCARLPVGMALAHDGLVIDLA